MLGKDVTRCGFSDIGKDFGVERLFEADGVEVHGLLLPLLVEMVVEGDADGAVQCLDVAGKVAAELLVGVVFGGDVFLFVNVAPCAVVEAAAPDAGVDVARRFGDGKFGVVQQVVEVGGAQAVLPL